MQAESTFTLVVSSVSLLITLLTTFIATYVITHFNKMRTEQQDGSVSIYFKYTSSLSVIFAALNTVFNTIYCLWLVFDPQHDDLVFYTQHPSHIQRITSTVSWYISKIALIWLINGRLYFVFKGKMLSDLQSNKKLFLFINIITTLITPIFLVSAYIFVYTQQLIKAEIAFNSIRLFLILLIIIILCMFSKRLLFLSIQFEMIEMHQMSKISKLELEMQQKCSNTVSQCNTKIDVQKNSNTGTETSSPDISKNNSNLTFPPIAKSPSSSREYRQSIQSDGGMGFLNITTRNAVLVLTIAISILFVILSFMAFRFLIGQQTRITLLLPMNVAAVDSLITCVAILCLFRFGDVFYPKICKLCNVCFKSICIRWAKKALLNRVQ